MAGGKVIGGPFDDKVINQLSVRSHIFNKTARTNDDLLYLAGRTGWAKLSSGVNINGYTQLAKANVLLGGILGRTGTNSYDTSTGPTGRGFRPMPGITGVTVRSINRFGVLKEATITYNCWDVSQLQELELLYMRPGFTALLEWGHSIAAKGNGVFDKTPQTVSTFFNGKASKEDIYKEIESLKESSSCNYDGILGFVKNFSWSFRPDGGYDCTTTLVSIGEIMESLTIDMDTPSLTTQATVDSTETAPATVIQSILKTIRTQEPGQVWDSVQKEYSTFAGKYLKLGGRPQMDVAKLFFNSITDATLVPSDGKLEFTYISLRTFCEILNGVGLVDTNDKSIIRLNTDIAPVEGSSTTPFCRYRSFKFHTSVDPGVCILISPGTKNWSYPENVYNPLYAAHEGSSDEILNIQMNVAFLSGVVDSLIHGPKEGRTLNNLFAPIFAQLNDVLGGINDINLYYDESKFTYYIVDRNAQVEQKDVSTLNVTGLKSTVTKFDFVTKLSPALTTMVAISAQAGAADVGLEAEALLRWNEGLTDRILGTKKIKVGGFPVTETPPVNAGSFSAGIALAQKQAAAETDPVKLRNSEQQTRRDTINEALAKCYNSTGEYNRENIDLAKTQYNYFATTYIQNHNEESANNKTAGPAGIIPFEMNLEMDGISGIKIGQAFRINDAIMPAKYNGVVGFIVTGVDHAITGNRWTTTLKAQTMVLQGKLKTNSTLTSSQNNQGFSTNKKRGIRTAAPTSAKKLASFGKVSDSVPIHAKPILDTIAYTEGTAAVGNNGYDILVGFEQLPGWTEDYKLGHPNKVVKLSRTLASSAAGRYQFLTSTWKGLKLSSFNKSNQDLGGWNLVQKQTAVKNSFEVAKEQISSNKIDVNKNLGFLTFLDGNYAVWASLVNRNGEARYGGQGGVFDPADIYKVYIEAVKKYT
jgi:muramidase (phage lysozyme)